MAKAPGRNKRGHKGENEPTSSSDPADEPLESMTGREGKELAPVEEFDEDDVDPLSGPSFEAPFIEKFLYAIIKAHPLKGKATTKKSTRTDRQRLDVAMEALVGRKRSGLPLPDDQEDKAVVWMALEHYNDRAAVTVWRLQTESPRGPKPKVRSDSELARDAIKKYFPDDADEQHQSRFNSLREKISGSYQRKLKYLKSATDHRQIYSYRATLHDDIRESIELQDLRKVRDIFKKHKVLLDLGEDLNPPVAKRTVFSSQHLKSHSWNTRLITNSE
jgi:hypothetical protein